jgi:hypothetical protein
MGLMLESLGRNQARLGLRPIFHPLGGPLPGLLVEIFQTVKGASRKEARFHGPETAFVARFSIGMIDRVTDELKTVAAGEAIHLGNDHRSASRAPQTGQIRVVDDASPSRTAPVHQRLVQKALHREAVEHTIKPHVLSFAVTQVQRTGGHLRSPTRQLELINGRVVLHFGARLVGDAVATDFLRFADPQFS